MKVRERQGESVVGLPELPANYRKRFPYYDVAKAAGSVNARAGVGCLALLQVLEAWLVGSSQGKVVLDGSADELRARPSSSARPMYLSRI
jgi:hypothetical protein